jgi:hypothetical protein
VRWRSAGGGVLVVGEVMGGGEIWILGRFGRRRTKKRGERHTAVEENGGKGKEK